MGYLKEPYVYIYLLLSIILICSICKDLCHLHVNFCYNHRFVGDICLTLKLYHDLTPSNHPKRRSDNRDFRSKAGRAISFLHLLGASVGFFFQDFDPLSLQWSLGWTCPRNIQTWHTYFGMSFFEKYFLWVSRINFSTTNIISIGRWPDLWTRLDGSSKKQRKELWIRASSYKKTKDHSTM